MIPYFKDVDEVKDSGVIYNGTFDQIKILYEDNPEMAGELAISAIELVLTGEISSTNTMIKAMLAQTKRVNEVNREKYERKMEKVKNKNITDQKLDQIAELVNEGMTQAQIGQKLGLSQQVVSYRVGVIRTKYPELLQKDFCTKSVQDSTNFVSVCKDQDSGYFNF